MDELMIKSAGVMALAGAQCGLIGVFVYLLNIPFIGVAIAHAAMAGGIWGAILGLPGNAGALVASVMAAITAGPAADRFKTSANISLAVIFAFCMGMAFMGAAIMPGGMQNATGYLWGSVLLANFNDIVFMSIALIVASLFIILFYRKISAVLFNRELAEANGINEKLFFYGILIITAIIIAINLNIIGGLMLFALIIIPPAIASKFSGGLIHFILFSVGIGVVGGAAGSVLSFMFNLPVSATVVILNCMVYFIVNIFKK